MQIEKLANNPNDVAILEEEKAKKKYPWVESMMGGKFDGWKVSWPDRAKVSERGFSKQGHLVRLMKYDEILKNRWWWRWMMILFTAADFRSLLSASPKPPASNSFTTRK